MGTTDEQRDGGYVLGHSAHELGRLTAQARLFTEPMLAFLRGAGIGPGMRVLDVGCGGGDVSLLVSSLVGPEGAVVGIDQSPIAVGVARRRAEELAASNLRFLIADASAPGSDVEAEGPFDAAVGRSVLEFVPDLTATLHAVAALVRPGGVIGFLEADWSGCRAWPEVTTFDHCVQWGREALRRTGADPLIGLKLPAAFVAAGLPLPTLSSYAAVGAGPSHPLYAHIAGLMRTLLPAIETHGVARADEVEIETLERRLGEEAVAAGATLVWVSLIGASTRKVEQPA